MTAGIENSEIYKYVSGKWKELSAEGESIKLQKTKKETDIGNLNEKTLPELEDLFSRQEKIIKNKKFISSLPDKGKKLQARSEEIRTVLEDLKLKKLIKCNRFSEAKEKIDIQELEWPKAKLENVKHDNILKLHNQDAVIVDEDIETEESNPLKLMANHSRVTPIFQLRSFENVDPVASIKEELDKLNIKDSNGPSIVPEDKLQTNIQCSYEEKVVESVKKIEENSRNKRKPFKPFQTLRNTSIPDRSKKHTSSLWVESAATGPIQQLMLKPAQTIPLGDSIRILNEKQNLEKEKDYYKTMEGLRKASKDMSIGLPDGPQMNYRDTNSTLHLLDEEFDSEEETYNYP